MDEIRREVLKHRLANPSAAAPKSRPSDDE
jgi:hypothetical protein